MLKFANGTERKSLVILLAFLVLGIAFFGAGRISVLAQSTPEISLVNSLTGQNSFIFYTNLTSVGYRFNATAWISEVVNAASWQVGVTYNSTILNATRAWIPASDTRYIFHGVNTFTPPPAFQPGSFLFGDLTVPVTAVNYATPKILGIIEFEILLAPPEEGKVDSLLSIDNDLTYTADASAIKNITVKLNGFFEYNWVAPSSQFEVKPGEYVTRKLETFNIEVWLNKIEISQRVIGAQFWLHYNASILNVVNVTEGSFLSQFKNSATEPYTAFFNITEDQTVKVGILILPNATGEWSVFPQGNGTLATITFQGIYQAQFPQEVTSALELTNATAISDGIKWIKLLPPINGLYSILSSEPSTVSLELSSDSIEYGAGVSLNGDINPDKEAVNVTVYSRFGTADWLQAGVVKTNATGGFVFSYIPAKAGSYEFKVNWTGDDATLPSESLVHGLTVNRATSAISVDVDKASVTLGSDVTLSGAITPSRPSVTVTISYRLTGDPWLNLTEVQTDSNGQFSFVWKPSQTGAFEVQASWSGDENTLEAVSDIKSVNVEGQSNVFLYVVVAVVVIIAAALIVYYWRTKKSKQGPSET